MVLMKRIILASCIRKRQRFAYSRFFSTLINDVSIQECSDIARALQKDGFGITTSRILSTADAVNHRMPDLFRGEFETGVYPDEWHWR